VECRKLRDDLFSLSSTRMMNGTCSTHVRDVNCQVGKRGPMGVTSGGCKGEGANTRPVFLGH